MKHLTKFVILTFILALSFTACTEDDSSDPAPNLNDILITTTTTSTSITLSWPPVDDCSWYKIYIAKTGETLEEVATYQKLNANPITYTITGLTANTSYDIKMDGYDYAIGGKHFATKSLTVSTSN